MAKRVLALAESRGRVATSPRVMVPKAPRMLPTCSGSRTATSLRLVAVEVHDYHDTLHPLLRRMHQRRLLALKSIGFVPTAPA